MLRIRSEKCIYSLPYEPDASVAALHDQVRGLIVRDSPSLPDTSFIACLPFGVLVQEVDEEHELRLAHQGVVLRQLSQSVDTTGIRESGSCDEALGHASRPC